MSCLGKIFMLDDDEIILSLYQELFEAKGYEVFATTNAYKLIMYAREMKPDVFILDINMPVLSGWDVLHMIKRDDKLKDIPVVMLSIVHDLDLAVAKGAAHFLNKPLDMDALMEIVESYCLGNKDHDVMLLEDFAVVDSPFERSIKEAHLNFFGIHDLYAAKRYLSKNHPRIVALSLREEPLKEAHRELHHEHMFDVSRDSDVRDILARL